MFENKKLVIFDLDGTIGRFDVNWAEVRNEIREHVKNNYRKEYSFKRLALDTNKAAKEQGLQCKQEMDAILLRHEMKHINNFKPIPEAVTLVKQLANYKTLAVCTGNQTPAAEKALDSENCGQGTHKERPSASLQ